jgi:hypothetical protein
MLSEYPGYAVRKYDRMPTMDTPDDDSSKNTKPAPPLAPRWMSAYGGLRALREETGKINRVLEQEFGTIEEDEWR